MEVPALHKIANRHKPAGSPEAVNGSYRRDMRLEKEGTLQAKTACIKGSTRMCVDNDLLRRRPSSTSGATSGRTNSPDVLRTYMKSRLLRNNAG